MSESGAVAPHSKALRESGDWMPNEEVPWPHAPTHRLSEAGTFTVTAGTYRKVGYFREPSRLEVLERGLIRVAAQFEWRLEAWAVFSNHYHFVGHATDSESLPKMLGVLHAKIAAWVNRLDRSPGRKVWHNYWDTRLTHERSYRARLNYVHQNAVKHGLVKVANQYPFCSAAWFERVASASQVASIYRFRTDTVNVVDDFEV